MAVITEKMIIEGMSCGHCVAAVKEALAEIDGVDVQKVDIGTAEVRYDDERVGEATIENAVREAGYEPVAHQRL